MRSISNVVKVYIRTINRLDINYLKTNKYIKCLMKSEFAI